MLTTALLIRWLISILIILLLLIGFVFLLKLLKNKKLFSVMDKAENNNLKIIDQLYIDSKNKIVKFEDNEKTFTILVGESNLLINKEDKEKK